MNIYFPGFCAFLPPSILPSLHPQEPHNIPTSSPSGLQTLPLFTSFRQHPVLPAQTILGSHCLCHKTPNQLSPPSLESHYCHSGFPSRFPHPALSLLFFSFKLSQHLLPLFHLSYTRTTAFSYYAVYNLLFKQLRAQDVNTIYVSLPWKPAEWRSGITKLPKFYKATENSVAMTGYLHKTPVTFDTYRYNFSVLLGKAVQ